LTELGADVAHVPLIVTGPPADGGAAMRMALQDLADDDWVVVTSVPGAAAVGPLVAGRQIRTAAVGTATAEALARSTGRPVDVVPATQRGAALAAELPVGSSRILVAQADIADPGLADTLRARGARVDTVVAYRTAARIPTPVERDTVVGADALVVASGSAARAWIAAGLPSPDVVVAIGPSTAAACEAVGLAITAVAADHSIAGVVEAVVAVLGRPA
jgi:uroporphyrinogen-III synthase/uroporphyrinogen III methyltransferase/synthase